MAMDLSDMQGEVRENIKRSVDALAAARLTLFLNWAQEGIADLHTFEEMKKTYTAATIADTRRYSFPTRMKDFTTIKLLDGSSSRKLDYYNARTFDELRPYPENDTTGRSTVYVDYGIYFELYPIPDAAYTMESRCSIYPIDLSVSTDESDLTRKDALICALATAFGFMTLRELSDADYWGGVVAKELMAKALLSDHSAEDWAPVARGFESAGAHITDYTNPWMGR